MCQRGPPNIMDTVHRSASSTRCKPRSPCCRSFAWCSLISDHEVNFLLVLSREGNHKGCFACIIPSFPTEHRQHGSFMHFPGTAFRLSLAAAWPFLVAVQSGRPNQPVGPWKLEKRNWSSRCLGATPKVTKAQPATPSGI